MDLKFDWTINVPVLFSAATLFIGIFKGWLQQRDFNREVLILLGKRAPRDERAGLLGDVADLQDTSAFHDDLIDLHHQKLGLDRRAHERRSSST